jgi:hypothetical protein
MGAATWTMACVLLAANSGPAETFYIHQRSFQVPFDFKDASRRREVKEVLLYLAAPDGKSWQPIGRATPDKDGFPFRAQEDGPYLFKMGVIDARTGKQDEGGEARYIVVDTVKPVLEIQSAERQGDDVLVRWNVTEKNPNWPTMRLEYLASDAPGTLWSRVAVPAPESGQTSFHVDGSAVAVRLSMADLAKNESGWVESPIKSGGGVGIAATGAVGTGGLPPLAGEGGHAPGPLPGPVADRGWSPAPPGGTVPTVLTNGAGHTGNDTPEGGGPGAQVKPAVVAASGSDTVPPLPGAATTPRPARGPLPPVQMVKKRQISIDYEVTKFGPSGIKSVELYVTRDDGRTWLRCDGEDNINVPVPAEPRGAAPSLKRSLTVELQADGLYGFYLVVKSGAGLGKPPPQNGIDGPQVRIEVDTTAPKADLFEPRPHPTRRDSLVLSWSATDNKLGPTPITLQWAERADGEWQPIGGGEMANSGEYVWQVPANVPPHVYLRLLVRDMAGNESVAQTAQPVLVDLNEPEVKPLQITVGR